MWRDSAIIGLVIITSAMVGLFPISLQQAALANFFAVGIPTVMLAVWAYRINERQPANPHPALFDSARDCDGLARHPRFLRRAALSAINTNFTFNSTLAQAQQDINDALPVAQTTVVTFLTFSLLLLVIVVKPPIVG